MEQDIVRYPSVNKLPEAQTFGTLLLRVLIYHIPIVTRLPVGQRPRPHLFEAPIRVLSRVHDLLSFAVELPICLAWFERQRGFYHSLLAFHVF